MDSKMAHQAGSNKLPRVHRLGPTPSSAEVPLRPHGGKSLTASLELQSVR